MHVNCADFVYKSIGELIQVLYYEDVTPNFEGSTPQFEYATLNYECERANSTHLTLEKDLIR